MIFYGDVYMFLFISSRRNETTDHRDGRRREQRTGEFHTDVSAGCAVVQEWRSFLVRHWRFGRHEEFSHGNSAVAAHVSGHLQERSDKAPERCSAVRNARYREDDVGQSNRRRMRRESDQHQGIKNIA